jgi:hypothetical protein
MAVSAQARPDHAALRRPGPKRPLRQLELPHWHSWKYSEEHKRIIRCQGSPRRRRETSPRPCARVSRVAEPATSSGSATVAPAPGLSVVEQLERLGDLRDKGVLTEDEFAAQKAKIVES